MHAGYQALRSEHTMNTRHVLPAKTPSAAVQADIDRILSLWARARSRFGAGGDYLFGRFGAADIMFAPVVTRFTTYSLPTDTTGRAYIGAVTAHPFMQEWLAGAAAEGWIIDKFEPASA
jgi:glutathione S-transferase